MKMPAILLFVAVMFVSFPILADEVYDRALENIANVTVPEQIDSRAQSFQKDVQTSGLKAAVSNCHHMVELAVPVSDGNGSYGAICDLTIDGETHNWMICNDDMVGHLALSHDVIASTDWIAKFTAHNCYGG